MIIHAGMPDILNRIAPQPDVPAQYEDKCIDYATPLKYLREQGFDGYINSEFEGQRDQQDMGLEKLVNEVEEVRRHHEMMRRLR